MPVKATPPTEPMDLDSDDEVRVANNNQRRTQRRRASSSPASERRSEGYRSETQDENARGDSTRALAAKLVRYALSCEHSRTAIKRDGFRKEANMTARQFRAVFAEAQIMLQGVFGMKMEELPVREKLTNAQKRGRFKISPGTSRYWIAD